MNQDQDEYDDENADKLIADVEAKMAGGPGGGGQVMRQPQMQQQQPMQQQP